MRPEKVVIVAPALDDFPRFPQAEKHVLVEAFVAQPAIKTFNECVLHRLSRFDVVPSDAGLRNSAAPLH
jgi:hypothetical protein